MDVGVYPYPHGDPLLIDKIVNEFLAQGRFDRLRKECMFDADTKPAYQNLQQRVESTVTQFLKKQVWRPDLNKNQLRDSLRKHILESGFFDAGINRIVDQVVNQNVLTTVFLPEVEEVVYNYLSIPKPSDKNSKKGMEEEKLRTGKENETKVSADNTNDKSRKEKGNGNQDKNYDDQKPKDLTEKKPKENEIFRDRVKTEVPNGKEGSEDKVKAEPDDKNVSTTPPPLPVHPVEKLEPPSEESQESLNKMEGLRINESTWTPVPDSDDSVPLEINEKSMSDSRDSEDSIMNQMSPISQGRLTPDLELEIPEVKPEVKIKEEKDKPVENEEKKPLTFIGRIPKIKREDSEPKKEDMPKEKLEVKNIYSSDESDSSKSYGKSDSDEKRRKNEKSHEERKRDHSEKKRDHSRSSKDRKRDKSKDRHKRDKSKDRDKKSSSSSSSSQRERSSSHHKSSHRHKDSKSKRKEDEKKKSKSTDDHGKERNKKDDRRSTDRDSNEREKDKSSTSRSQGESRKREKEQPKEESKTKGDKKEDAQVEKEVDTSGSDRKIVQKNVPDVLDFDKLFRNGALTRFEFPKISDDFYVKFNSTGFKYFEDWEKSKLDCEEEFKEFVDEAENDLSLLSDDDSDFEFENNLVEENRKTIENLHRGLGNFSHSLTFDPSNSEFYKWTNNKFYQKVRKKDEIDESEVMKKNRGKNKENREKETIALHLKLLNRYKRKAMRMGKPRRRQKRPGFGIKEKNDNRSESNFGFGKAADYLPLPMVGTEHPVPESINSLNIFETKTVTLPESPEENEEWGDGRKHKPTAAKGNLPQTISINLPPSPDSDDVHTNSDPKIEARKRIHKESVETTQKKQRRNYSQKYDSQDLYKPRLILNSSRTRGRERGLEQDVVSIGSSDSKVKHKVENTIMRRLEIRRRTVATAPSAK